MKQVHVPVLAYRIIQELSLSNGDSVIDATLDGGGHTEEFLKCVSPRGKVLGIERDSSLIALLNQRIKEEKSVPWNLLSIVHGNYVNIKSFAEERGFVGARAIFFDLGVSSWHFDSSKRGFSFKQENDPLGMYFDESGDMSAEIIVNSSSKDELKKIFIEYGEFSSGYASSIADEIYKSRKHNRIKTVGDLINSTGIKGGKSKSKLFQAIRIAVNDELNALSSALVDSFSLLTSSGIIAVISYHSLEDRIVKNYFKTLANEKVGDIINKKPITASPLELKNNTRAKSAKLRMIRKIV